ncbi:unnamed protein product [Eruca vesicaria subsp. sativa]|uniref:BHLH domain-containing protein n=1 Tax=Eruca vesicaria subsp. sativa TaxID=29727 RepID=A0ABC8KMJ3_ERUVS|nr:unnamed protein product [Eruca vesicaria subsp. sativa]
MHAFGTPLFPTFGWTLTREYDSYSVVEDNNNNGTFHDFPVPKTYGVVHQQTSLVDSVSSAKIGIDKNSVVIKKLNHNANERNRRKKTNYLFSCLHSCLPDTDETKQLSIPQTLSRSLQYIPELQQEVKKLIQKKEDLLGQRERYVKPQPKVAASYFSTVFATKVRDNEVMVQISSSKIHKFSIYNVLSGLEANGFVLVDVSSSSSRGDRVFYTLNLQVDKVDSYKLIMEELSQRILYFYEICGNPFM